MESTALDIVTNAEGLDGLASWSEARRTGFVDTFQERCDEAQYIAHMTAMRVVSICDQRGFLSQKHWRILESKYNFQRSDPSYSRDYKGSRSREELSNIADQQAKEVIKGLPPLNKAVQLIDKDISEKITRRDAMLKTVQKALDDLNEIPSKLHMLDHEDMLVKDFIALHKSTSRKRAAKIAKIKEVSEEASQLSVVIERALYKGLPGLSDAIMESVVDIINQAKALTTVRREVSDQVMYGDSEKALEILGSFKSTADETESVLTGKIKSFMTKLRADSKKKLTKGKKK